MSLNSDLVNPFTLPFSQWVWSNKYRNKATDQNYEDTFARVARTLADDDHVDNLNELLCDAILVPGGRILAGAGTVKEVTLQNCYVNGRLEDSMKGIIEGLSTNMLTQQMGGGIGTNFTPLRPNRAILKRTGEGSQASGPIPFMKTWDASCATIFSAGARRGAMMAMLAVWHPDIIAFIQCKQKKGELTNFNISVIIDDAFMRAVATNDIWLLYHATPPVDERSEELTSLDFEDADDVQQYVYAIHQARDIMNLIMENTYKYSEPGIFFGERTNDLNNLSYCEELICTNPCGEQPLPPHGTCNLGHVNLAQIVKHPFIEGKAEIDWDLLNKATRAMMRMLDKVIDETKHPLEEQRLEQEAKRRTGLGYTGLGNMLSMLGLRYGSQESVLLVDTIGEFMANVAYSESARMAEELGSFPLYDVNEILNSPFVSKLSESTRLEIQTYGLRNGVLLTIAPVGTTSAFFGGVSSGIEPVFALEMDRNVKLEDNSFELYKGIKDYGYLVYTKLKEAHTPNLMSEDVFTLAEDVTIDGHLDIMAAAQKWVDASISKTINVPEETSFEDFTEIYLKAYSIGLKGITTYRPSDERGQIIMKSGAPEPKEAKTFELPKRPEALRGATYKLNWPSWTSALYITINQDEHGNPFEIFMQSKDARHQEWITALTLMMSAVFRRGYSVSFIPQELRQIHSTHDSSWIRVGEKSKHYPSLVAYIADILEKHFIEIGAMKGEQPEVTTPLAEPGISEVPKGEMCPACSSPGLMHQEGCATCINCGYSQCS